MLTEMKSRNVTTEKVCTNQLTILPLPVVPHLAVDRLTHGGLATSFPIPPVAPNNFLRKVAFAMRYF
jgi:hypothetical protein